MLDKELLKYIKGNIRYIVYTLIVNILSLVLNVGITALIIYVIYHFITHQFIAGIYMIVLTLGLLAIKCFLFYLGSKITTTLADNVVYKLRSETYEKYLKLGGRTPFTVSEMAQLSTEGIEQLRLYYSSYLPNFFYAMIAPMLLFVLFMFIEVKVAILYLCCVPLIPMSIVMVSKWAKRIFHKYWNQYTSLGDSFLDNISGMKELKIFNYDHKRQKEMMDESESFRKITMKVLVMQLASVTIMDLVAFGGAGIGIVLSLDAMYNGLNIYLTLFMVLIGAEFFLPMRALGSAFHVAMNGATAGKKILKLLACKEKEDGNTEVSNITSVELINVNFAYAENIVIKSLNITLDKGLHSIVGLSGSGKSTIAKICMGIEDISEGEILINGQINFNQIKRGSFYTHAAYISNNTYLFHTTIYEAFRFYNPQITEDEIWELLKIVKLDSMVMRNGGLSFKINESATNVSGGEKQRLVLAFYLSREYDFYIFDEVTSNIDIESEEIIMDIIKKLAEEKIVLLISHRLKNVLGCDKIYYLENTKIVEFGKACELLSKESRFKTLYQSQQMLEVINYEA